MDIADVRPRPLLSAKVKYSFPDSWELVRTEGVIAIVPAPVPKGLVAYFVSLACAVSIAAVMLAFWQGNTVDGWWIALGGAGIAGALGLAGRYVFSEFRSEVARGPILRILAKDRIVELPRLGTKIEFSHIVRWEVLSGARMEDGRLWPDEICELRLVFQDGGTAVIPIVGAIGLRNPQLLAAAEQCAEWTDAQLVVTCTT